MTVSVTYRRVRNKWHIRFRARGRSEIVRSYPADLVSEREVRREVAAFQRRIAIEGWDPWAGGTAAGEAVTVADAIDAWVEHLSASGAGRSAVKNGRSQVGVSARAGGFDSAPLHMVTTEMWQQGASSGKISSTTQSNRVGSVRRFMQWAAKSGHVGPDHAESVCSGLVPRRRERRVSQHLTRRNMEAICALLRPDMADFAMVLYLTGMRAGEAVAMKGAWVDLEGGWITVGDRDFRPKNRRNRSVPLVDELVPILRARMGGPDDRIFSTVSYETARKHFRKAVDAALGKAGAGLSLHSLRHTYAINLIMSGFELYEIIQYTGHHSVTMLEANYADWIVRRKPESFRERFRAL